MLRVVYSNEDEFGSLEVSDDGVCHILSFAAHDEQSRCLKSAPHILQYEYTQAMLLVLLFCQPKRILALGLGGGTLLTALHYLLPSVKMTAVELRPAVIEVAYQYFQLPRSKRLQVIAQNADTFLLDNDLRQVDIVFADLYHSTGIDALQLKADFIARCAEQLKPEGWLVLNCWLEHREDPLLRASLQHYFQDIRTVLTGSKNWVVLAGKVADYQSQAALRDKAQQLSSRLECSLTRQLGRLHALN